MFGAGLLDGMGGAALDGVSPSSSATATSSVSTGFTTPFSSGSFNFGAGAGADTSLLTVALIVGGGLLVWLALRK